jgi:ribulose-phosphate 3-epimerase
LGVNPGLSGQKFIDSTYKVLEYVNIIRAKYKLKLFIDGGINKDNIKNIIKFKPDKIIIGSSIFNNDDPIINFNYFQELIKENKS